jgi:hypothetical protein
MDTLYLIEFEATQAGTPTSREQTIERLDNSSSRRSKA